MNRFRTAAVALVTLTLGLVALLARPFAVELWTERQLNQALLAAAGDQEILGHWSGVWTPGSCCAYIVSAIALVPDRPAPPEVRVARRVGGLIDEGAVEGSPYEPTCRTCGTGGVTEAFAMTDAEDAQVWFLLSETWAR